MKKNNKGFTLVELVVVSMLMVMIMGAILNFITPLNGLFKSTQNTADANDIGTSVMDYFERETRYATNIVVLEDFSGMPSTKDGYLLNPAGNKAYDVLFTDVIIIDNVNNRGSMLANYDADDSPAHRKEAKGVVMKAKLGANGITPSSIKIPLTEAMYSDFGVDFSAKLSKVDNNNCLSVGMQIYKPEYNRDTGVYDFETLAYNQTRDMELVNINLLGKKSAKKREMEVRFYSDARNDDNSYVYEAADRIANRFGRATAPGGLVANQSALYDTGKHYTYIFFTKTVPTTKNGAKVKIRLLSKDGAVLDTDNNFVSGNPIPAGKATAWQTHSGIASYYDQLDSSGNVVRYSFEKLVSTTGLDLDYYTNNGVDQNMDFSPAYDVGTVIHPVVGHVQFLTRYGDDGTDLGGWTKTIKIENIYADDPSFPSYNSKLSALPNDPVGDDDHTFDYWCTDPSGSGETISESDLATKTFGAGTKYYYAIFKEKQKYEIKFQDESGNEISGYTKEYLEGFINYTIDKPSDPTPPSGKQFLGWYVDGDQTKQALDGLARLDSALTFAPVFEDAPSGFNYAVQSVDRNFGWQGTNGAGTFTFNLRLTNTLTTPIKGAKLKVKFNHDIGDLVALYGLWNTTSGPTMTKSGDELTIDFVNQDYAKIQPNGSLDLQIVIRPAIQNFNATFDMDSFTTVSVVEG